MNWLRANIWEIDRSRLLSYFGSILSILHVVNYFYWVNRSQILNPSHNSTILCWDFSHHCGPLLNLPPPLFAGLLTAYLVLSGLGFLAFISRRVTKLAWTILLLVNLINIFYYISDASLAIDVQALLLLLNFGYLFIPSKATLVRYGVLVFYFIEGWREMTPDWLTGKALQGVIPLPLKGLEWVAVFGIAAKWTLPLLLLSPIGQRLVIAVLGLLAYHAVNFYFKSDFESIVMMCLVVYFAIDYFERRRLEREALYQSYAHPEPSKIWWPVYLAIFVAAQLPQLTAKTSALQLFKVEGPAAITDCLQINFANYDNHVEQLASAIPTTIKAQLKCHTSIALNSAKALCPDLQSKPGFKSLSSYFMSRNLSATKMKLIYSEDQVCQNSREAK
jgi:hypothetical protein